MTRLTSFIRKRVYELGTGANNKKRQTVLFTKSTDLYKYTQL